MKVSKEQSTANRQALIDAATRLYCEHGIEGVGLAEISREAGFTHGGFYGRFDSKEALVAEACTASFARVLERLHDRGREHADDLNAHLRRYFSRTHRDTPGTGCPMAALAVDAAREQGLVGEAMAEGIGAYLQKLALHRADGSTAEPIGEEDKARAIHTLAVMVGGVVLARACAGSAPALSDEILATSLRVLTR
jgi:TetR/AcrR family transcriptional repressor of nem operon